MVVRYITKQDKLEPMKISSVCFNYPFSTNGLSEEDFLDKIYSSPTEKLHASWSSQLVVYDDHNNFMACMATIPFTFYFDGNAFSANGIGNVCTYPHHRKKGAIRAMFEKMLKDSYQNGQVFSYLYPFSEAFYGKFGYRHMSHSKFYEFCLSGFPETDYDGEFSLLTQDTSTLLNDFKIAYDAFARNYNMMVQRDDFDWGNITDAKAYLNNNYAYLYKDKHGTPKGYLVFKRDGRCLRCRELVFDSFETLKAIFSFVKPYSTDNDTFCCHIPALIHMEHFSTDFSLFHAEMKNVSNGMVRVINVQKTLENAKYIGTGSICLKIKDHWIPENNGLFKVSFVEDRATSVTFIAPKYEETTPIDMSMDISFFSAAIVGNYDVNEFSFMDGLKIYCDFEKLKQIFYKKNSFINNYF